MSAWSEVRRLARLRHAELAPAADEFPPAAVLLAAAEEKTGVKRIAVPPDDVLLDGAEAAYDRDCRHVYFSNATEPCLASFHIAHEYGHHWLDDTGIACDHTELSVSTPAEPGMSSVGEADAYSPKERAEAQANLFAREFLLPREKLRRWCSRGSIDARALAAELGVPVDLVMQQMADALLLPDERDLEAECRPEEPPDDSQGEAIRSPAEARMVRAGPGTGKTRTLVGRIAHLVAEGENPTSIVALTYSNAAAQDLAMRIRAAIGERATSLWSGTFHAYGLEMLRKYGGAIGLPIELKHIDRTDQLMLLEELLPKLQLDHYLDLHEPLRALASILNAISRAKDELATPGDYERCAQRMFDDAPDAASKLAGRRALEVARAYAVYEDSLRQRGWLDFGDLIARSVELLTNHPEVRATIREQKRHILVDEYQDMNRASGVLLKELVEPGHGPWVVGDVRQAIYRFRGASPTNMTRFPEDFPGAQTTDLSVNYRSGGKIVRTFEAFGTRMGCAPLSSSCTLTSHRGEDNGEVHYELAATREAEAHGIATVILNRVSSGGTFGGHSILGKTHTILARIAGVLEAAGVPCLYFGDFFERQEIRDLLALVSVVSEPKGVGLLRVAQFARYAIPPSDVTGMCAWRRNQRVPMLAAIRRSTEIDGLSEAGRQGFARLASDFAGVDWPMTAHTFLMRYLFGTGTHLKQLLDDESVAGQQRRLAVYQLLHFAFSFKAPSDVDPKRAFLDHIRRLEVLDEEKQLRQLPAAAVDIDAVRLMTIHASKGLEFPCVHVPALTKANFPSPARHEPCPLPTAHCPPACWTQTP
jgi:DNA helicase-2/ATP-dependent DNA helicase PcrA